MENVEINSKNLASQKRERTSNLELLRIISIILIIAHHYAVHGGWNMPNELSLNRFIIQFLSLGGKLGVNCFVLITGYFMINSKFSFKKLLKIVGQVLFYSITIMIIFKIFKISNIGIRETVKSFFPIITSKYWFATAYVELYILTPFINKFVNNVTEKEHKQLIIILTVLLSLIPTLTNSLAGIGNLIWFIFLYIFASYIRKYSSKLLNKTKLFLILFIIGYLSIFIFAIILDFLDLKTAALSFIDPTYLREMNSVLMLFCSATIFLFFKNINIGSKKIINTVSMTTFGIYLIHDNNFVRPYLWEQIAKNNSFYNSSWLFLHAIVTIILVFTISMIIDYFRIILIEKPLFSFIDKKLNKSFEDKIRKKYIDNSLLQNFFS